MSTSETSQVRDDSANQIKIVPDSSFFKSRPATALPTPTEVRAINRGNTHATSFDRPPPVVIPSLGLFVKYGAIVTLAEIETQDDTSATAWSSARSGSLWLGGGWRAAVSVHGFDRGRQFTEAMGGMDEEERLAVCAELRDMVRIWRGLEQDKNDQYIVGHSTAERYLFSTAIQKTTNQIIADRSRAQMPFASFKTFCGIYIDNQDSIVFTHNDLIPPNILLTHGSNPKVAAIIDCGQSGWYPAYWGYCKARRVGLGMDHPDFNRAFQEEWWAKYMPLVLDS
ncbi:hypothetical protein SI65_09298 [Aspergillus cristatus]|uniref:Aminoglycoside phosphotransferase domain-containing protein n=1 Tax=Aspergillus cristatus TaxID=573508 RepID=A0A1E3B349_ASPCR|nr:hypothetical protein SI65_09298 [Aspergillus cristatus]